MSRSQGRQIDPRVLLLVEDSFGDAMLAQEAFAGARSPIQLVIAADGEEALSRLRQEPPFAGQPPPDLVMLDLNLPRMGGLGVLKAIKGDPALRHVPVIVMTGSNASDEIRESYASGASAYIVKPLRFEELEEVVAAVDRFWFGVAALPSAPAWSKTDAA